MTVDEANIEADRLKALSPADVYKDYTLYQATSVTGLQVGDYVSSTAATGFVLETNGTRVVVLERSMYNPAGIQRKVTVAGIINGSKFLLRKKEAVACLAI